MTHGKVEENGPASIFHWQQRSIKGHDVSLLLKYFIVVMSA
jgi:hypothetical protein